MSDAPHEGAPADRARDRALERVLVANFLVHALAIVAMALLLLPLLPGGSNSDEGERVAKIAVAPWRLRVGWLPWQGCAVVDLLLAIAMVRVRWLSRAGALFVLVSTLAAHACLDTG